MSTTPSATKRKKPVVHPALTALAVVLSSMVLIVVGRPALTMDTTQIIA